MADNPPIPAAESLVVGKTTTENTADFVSHARRVFIDALKTFFAEPDMFGGPNPYRWTKDVNTSKIVIAAEYSEEQKVRNPNHLILVNRGPIRIMRTSFQNIRQERVSPFLTKPLNTPTDQKRLGKQYVAMIQTDIQTVCFSRRPAEAEQIAQAATMCFLTFQQEIRSRAKLHRIENPTVGNESPVQSSDAQIMLSVVPVTVPIYMSISWHTIHDPETITVEPILTQVEDC